MVKYLSLFILLLTIAGCNLGSVEPPPVSTPAVDVTVAATGIVDTGGTPVFRITGRPTTTSIFGSTGPSQTPEPLNIAGQFAFARTVAGGDDIFVMNADRSGVRNLTNSPGDDDRPAWSPDGLQFAFTSTRTGNVEIFAMNSDGSNVRNLSNNQATDVNPDWSPMVHKSPSTATGMVVISRSTS
jgi:dipeptidyl aminopeptidase/acylaminoacyl peptidase